MGSILPYSNLNNQGFWFTAPFDVFRCFSQPPKPAWHKSSTSSIKNGNTHLLGCPAGSDGKYNVSSLEVGLFHLFIGLTTYLHLHEGYNQCTKHHKYDTSFAKFKNKWMKTASFRRCSQRFHFCKEASVKLWNLYNGKSIRKNRCAPCFPAAPLYFPLCEPLPVVLRKNVFRFFSRELRICYEVCQYVENRVWCTWKFQVSCGSLNFHQQTKLLKLAHFQLPNKYGTFGRLGWAPSFFKIQKHQTSSGSQEKKIWLVRMATFIQIS